MSSRPRVQMGVGSLGQKFRPPPQQQQLRSAKVNSCSNQRNGNYSLNSTNSTNETKSSQGDSLDKTDLTVDSTDKADSGSAEAEPEWFSCPASRHDVIDLHGFDEDEETRVADGPERSISPKKMFDDFSSYGQRMEGQNLPSSAYRRSSYNQQNRYVGNNFNVSSGSSSYYNPRYRNPLHQSRCKSSPESSEKFHKFAFSASSSSFGRPDASSYNQHEPLTVNPFFDMWKVKNAQQENFNYLNMMNPTGPLQTIADVENAMKHKVNVSYFLNNQPMNFPNSNSTVPQFFNGFPGHTQGPLSSTSTQAGNQPFGGGNFSHGFVPTQEQLQHYTSEIMRNAIMRKHYQKDQKFPK